MIRTRTTRASRAMVLALLASAAAVSVARADTYTWNGKGDSPNWDDPFISSDIGYANWTPFGTHLPGSGDDVIFGTGFVSGNPNLNGSRSVNSFTIDTSSSFSIVGNPGDMLSIDSGILTRTAASSGTQTFAVPTWIGGGSATPVDLSLDGTGSVVFSGGLNIQLGVPAASKSGTADMIITGATSTINAPLNVTAGNFIVDGATVQGDAAGNYQVQNPGSSIIVRNGGTLGTSGNITATGGATMTVTDAGSQLGGGSVLVGAGGQGVLNVVSGGQVSGRNLHIGDEDGGNGVVNVQGGNINAFVVDLAPTGHSSGTLNISETGTKATPFEVNLNGNGSSNTSNPNGISTVNINPGATLESSFLSLFQSNAVVNVNAGSLIVDEAIFGDPGTTINLQADPAGGHALVLNAINGISASNVTGAGSVILTGTPPYGFIGSIRVVLEGANTYTGATVVQKGDLQLTFGSSNSSFYDVQSSGRLELGPAIQEVVNLGYGTILSEPGGEVDYEKVLLNGGLIQGAGKNIVAGSDSVVFNGTTIGADATVSTVAGTGTPTFNQVTVAGNLLLNSPLNMNASTIASSGRVDVNSGSNVTSALLTSNGTLFIHSGGSVTNTAANLTLGSGSITTLDSGGALTLANSTALDLRGGLLTNNGIITGPVNVYFGSVAKGGGTYSGSLNVLQGGRVSPGNSPGTLTSTASSWNQGGIYHWDIADLSGPAGTAWDLWNAGTTSITPTGSFEIEIQSLGSLPGGGLQGWNPSQPYSWLIATADNGAFSAEALSHLAIVDAGFADTNSLAGGTFSLTDSPDGNNLYLTYSAAPEPASFACLGLFGAGMLLRRKRRRSA